MGTPQGAVASPLLANVYLHYVFDLWVEVWREKLANGDMIVVRYADERRCKQQTGARSRGKRPVMRRRLAASMPERS